MNMPLITVIYSIALILLGLIGYFATGQTSKTALIPAAFGIVVLIFGILAFKENMRKTAMHIASVLGLLGFLGGIRGIPSFISMIASGEAARPAAAISQTIMSVVSLIFFLFCLKSFIDARRDRAKLAESA
ncbi:MAG: hypothetical protein GF310_07065 [candidate division Zixibacteria bacterium]|nr:hypothetical protein [candidate division Zixibacteria bacterium]